MGHVAIVTDSASDLVPGADEGITVIPLVVAFGDREFRAGQDLTADRFWDLLTEPGAPFPLTAATSPRVFEDAFRSCLAAGAESIVCVTVAGTLSAVIQSARLAREVFADREILVVDSWSASMGEGMLAQMGAEMAAAGASAGAIAQALQGRQKDLDLYVVLETLEYLRRGGRIGGARAALGTMLSVKPIITLRDGTVEQADRVRTRLRARQRLIELLSQAPVERIALLHARAPDIEAFGDELAQATGFPRERITTQLIGPTIGAHLGPGAYGAVVMRRSA